METAEKNIRKKVRYLILKGHKPPEIGYEPYKTETDISSRRSHIRTKLRLTRVQR